jgi:hypothetical protein
MAKGLISEERFATLFMSLEQEQQQLKASIPELTPEIVHEFIEKIVVSKPEKVDGKRHQTVDIYYNTIGLWYLPPPEKLEQDYLDHYQDLQNQKEKAA